MSNKNAIAEFFESFPLYKKMEVDMHFYHPLRFEDFRFKYFCPNEKSLQTFVMTTEPGPLSKLERMLRDSDDIDKLYNPYIVDFKINIVTHLSGLCQYCKEHKVHFLIHTYSEGEVEKMELFQRHFTTTLPADYKKSELKTGKIFIAKVGQLPGHQIKAEKEVYNFLTEENKGFYSKALICISHGFGVGAFAYMRKIVEKEIIRIVEELANDESTGTNDLRALLNQFQEKKQMSLIVDNIYPFLPSSLKILDRNPLKVLYSMYSEGLHNANDEECMDVAIGLDQILQFTIRQLRQEQNELKKVRHVMRNLPDIKKEGKQSN